MGGGSSEAVIEVVRKEKEAELASKQKKWEEKRKKYHKEIDDLKNMVKEKENEIAQKGNQSNMARGAQEDLNKIKDELNGKITKMKSEHDQKIKEYETKLEKAMTEKGRENAGSQGGGGSGIRRQDGGAQEHVQGRNEQPGGF